MFAPDVVFAGGGGGKARALGEPRPSRTVSHPDKLGHLGHLGPVSDVGRRSERP
ncbi:hypothetical protein ACN9M0_12180 [Streptomyces sp. R-07]|uniref:hypothetical protein n=1 Tax=unclassified Streptomyces TaxID=2593676 RepID=UPI003417B1F5